MKYRNEEFVEVDGEPKIMYTPYIYKRIVEYSNYYTVDNGKKIKIVEKGE